MLNNLINNIVPTLGLVCSYIFYGLITLACINYIAKSLFFIKPMCTRYKIMSSDLSNDIRGRYPYILIALLTVAFFLYITYITNFYLFIFIVIIYILYIYFLNQKYRKFNLLDYINEFSLDLFDWEKIYDLPVSEEIKKQCFQIHYLDYDEFGNRYLKKIKDKLFELENNKNQTETKEEEK